MSTWNKPSLLLLSLILSISLFSQEKVKTKKVKLKEAGVVFQSFDNFGLTYRIGNNNSLWRLNSLLVTGGKTRNGSFFDNYLSSSQNAVSRSSIGLSLAAGREHRKSIGENIQIRYGNDLLFGYDYQKFRSGSSFTTNSQVTNEQYSIGLGFVFGFNYVIKDVLVIGAEIVPAITYFENSDNRDGLETKISGMNYGLSNNSALVSIVFRY